MSSATWQRDLDRLTKQVDDVVTLFALWAPRREDRDAVRTEESGRKPTGLAADRAVHTDWVVARVPTTNEVSDHLKSVATKTLDALERRSQVAYTADAELNEGEIFVIDDDEGLAELEPLRRHGAQSSELPPIVPKDLPSDRVKIYGVAIGRDQPRPVLIRKANPVKTSNDQTFWASGEQKLKSITTPLFVFHSEFDLVVTEEWAAVTSQYQFELLYRSSPAMRRHVTAWAESISSSLPMSEESEKALLDAALSDSRLWRRLRAIHRRGHLAKVSVRQVQRYAESMDLNGSDFVRDGEVVFEQDDKFTMMALLNEDLFKGHLTDEAFEAQRKSEA